jgi:hypothetical protein
MTKRRAGSSPSAGTSTITYSSRSGSLSTAATSAGSAASAKSKGMSCGKVAIVGKMVMKPSKAPSSPCSYLSSASRAAGAMAQINSCAGTGGEAAATRAQQTLFMNSFSSIFCISVCSCSAHLSWTGKYQWPLTHCALTNMLAKVQGEGVGFVVRNLECGVMVRAEEREGVRLETLDIVRARASPCTERESGARAGLHATVGSRQGGARPAGREARILWIFGFYFRVLFSGRSNPKKRCVSRGKGRGNILRFSGYIFGFYFRVGTRRNNPKI